MKYPFNFPMRRYERITGCIFIPLHAAVIPVAVAIICALFAPEISEPHMTLITYIVSFILVVSVMFRFLKKSFSDIFDGFWRMVQAVILGYAMYYVLIIATNILLTQIMSVINPNSELFAEEAATNFGVMAVVSVVLAPIVEETLFRGALFGTIRQKSRIAAYVVSFLVFSFYHLWQFLLIGYDWTVLLYAVQYLPASIALAWCYERGGTIWSPILLHAAINLAATLSYR